MLYQRSLTIPANTPESSPVSATLKLTVGTITRMEVEFPAGCVYQVGARVRDKGWQVMPWTRDEWLNSENYVVFCDAPYPLASAPYVLTLIGYNEDTVNDHTLQLRVTLREGEIEEFLMLEQFLDTLRGD